MTRLRSVIGGLIWVAIVVVIALGAAGLVTALDHPPGSTGRTDLTAPGDAEVTPQLDAAEAAFAALADQVDALGTEARTALAALNGSDPAVAEAAIAERRSPRVGDHHPHRSCCAARSPMFRMSARRRPG